MLKTMVIVGICIACFVGNLLIARHAWKRYIILYLASSLAGLVLCYGFVFLGFYFFPSRVFPAPIPVLEMVTVLPFIVMASVYYSPAKWSYKIPFYWTVVHVVMFLEVLAMFPPMELIEYRTVSEWDVWDSYSWWWIYLLVFEYVGGLIVAPSDRKPIDSQAFRYGKILWVVIHFILISTIFLAGVYVGKNLK